MLAAAIEAETGYRVLAYDTTMEHGIPSAWAMAVSARGSDGPALACFAGVGLDPEQAAGGALSELGPILADLIARYPDIEDRGRAMAADASKVIAMDDHSVLYTSREAAHRLEFLTSGAPTRSLADMRSLYRTAERFHNVDLADDLAAVVRRLHRHGLDVIVVDQTTPEHRTGGFRCVKVIVSGTLSMTFGHHNRRLHGLSRLYVVPRVLGFRDRDRDLDPEEINTHPHPFP